MLPAVFNQAAPWPSDAIHSAAAGPGGAGLAVSEVHDVNGCLMPPVKHHHNQYVPQLMARTQVIHLA